jgi:hypothetical protein
VPSVTRVVLILRALGASEGMESVRGVLEVRRIMGDDDCSPISSAGVRFGGGSGFSLRIRVLPLSATDSFLETKVVGPDTTTGFPLESPAVLANLANNGGGVTLVSAGGGGETFRVEAAGVEEVLAFFRRNMSRLKIHP